MERNVQPERLDNLPADDPHAIRSRRDLRRINALMGNARLCARAILAATDETAPNRLVDLGTGDGHFLWQLTRHLPALPGGLDLLLVDRSYGVDDRVLEALRGKGYRPRFEQADVLNWLRAAPAHPGTWMVANLFLHHFSHPQLAELFALAAGRSALVCACEPFRAPWPLAVSRLLWLIGANAVTRHDATISVRSGFAGGELSALWPNKRCWTLSERRAGMFSHIFVARQDAATNLQGPIST